jgi:hypothetical protein
MSNKKNKYPKPSNTSHRAKRLARWLYAKSLCAASVIAFLSILGGMTTPVSAQYTVYQWASFEDGRFPIEYTPIGTAFESTVRMVQLDLVPGVPSSFRSAAAARETGRFGIAMKADPNIARLTGIGTGVILQRDLLGNTGRALYQADFYIPPAQNTAPSLAVLAMAPLQPGQQEPDEFYRFGITKNRGVYFSNVVKDGEEAQFYEQDSNFFQSIPRPAWHRFAIVFEGYSTIRCFVDGNEPSFSPLEHDSLRNLQVGIMLADDTNSYICYVDNVSIQWSPNDVPLPDSPYGNTWSGDAEAFEAAPQATAPAAVTSSATGPISWLDSQEGAQVAQAQGKNMLVTFVAPRIRTSATLEQLLTNDPQARAFVAQHVPVKIDVNQLLGGTLAAHYQILRVPTIFMMDPGGREISRAVFSGRENWATLQSKLAQ